MIISLVLSVMAALISSGSTFEAVGFTGGHRYRDPTEKANLGIVIVSGIDHNHFIAFVQKMQTTIKYHLHGADGHIYVGIGVGNNVVFPF